MKSSLQTEKTEPTVNRYLADAPSEVASRHFDGCNALSGDGHVKFRRLGLTTANKWSIQNDNRNGLPHIIASLLPDSV